MLRKVYIVAAKRTPFGAFGGSLSHISATDLAAESTKQAIESCNLEPKHIDSIIVGNVIQSSKDAAYLARHVGLKCNMDISKPALTINRLCGSGFESVHLGADDIQLGRADVVVCAGTENMTNAPFCLEGNKARFGGVKLGNDLKLYDSLWSGLTDSYAGTPMGITAENLAEKYGITRQECDELAIRSQTLWGKANAQDIFKHEIAPITIKSKKHTKVIDTDEHPRPETKLDKISTLKPVFKKDGTVTAANASGICDGAGSIILASEDAVKEYDLKPLCRIAQYVSVGCEPTIMGIGPAPAIQSILSKTNLNLSSISRIEVNEAFAAQYLAVEKELGLDRNKVNLHGGAISLGHPLAASGSRILAHLANEFAWNDDLDYAIGSACIGGGQGIATLLERV